MKPIAEIRFANLRDIWANRFRWRHDITELDRIAMIAENRLCPRCETVGCTDPDSKSCSDNLISRYQVQLAGCMVAAEGGPVGEVKQGDFGWSCSFETVRELREKYDALLAKEKAPADPGPAGA